MSIEAAVTTSGPLVHSAAVSPALVAARHRAGGRGQGSIHPPRCAVSLDGAPCPQVEPHSVRSPGVTLQFWLPCCHPTAPGPLVSHSSCLPCRYDLPSTAGVFLGAPVPSQESLAGWGHGEFFK